MKTLSIYQLHKDRFLPEQERLVEIVKTTAKPDMIFLLGAELCRKRTETIYQTANSPLCVSGCFLLILISEDTKKELLSWQEKIEHHCKSLMPVTTLVLLSKTFQDWVRAGHCFALKVLASAIPIYDAATISLPEPPDLVMPTDKDMEALYTIGLKRSKAFFAGAELYRVRGQFDFAVFMLHQATEQCLRTLLKLGTGYHSNVHSLDRLLKYGSLVSPLLAYVFAEHHEEDRRLLQVLQKAYIDCRYTEDFKVKAADVDGLMAKVSRMQEILVQEAEQFLQPEPKTIMP